MTDIFYQLLRGFAYRSIEHQMMKAYTTWLPLIVATLAVSLLFFLDSKLTILGKYGLLERILELLVLLPGFYFAGLAAVATFGGSKMDAIMADPPPQILLRIEGKPVKTSMTNRMFLSYLFAYLVVLSFAVCFVTTGVLLLSDFIIKSQNINIFIEENFVAWSALKFSFLFLYFASVGSLVISTLHGIYFLVERMSQPD